MLKKVISFISVIGVCYSADTSTDDYFQILSRQIFSDTNTTSANNDVVGYLNQYYVSAQHLYFDKVNSKLLLENNAILNKNNSLMILSDTISVQHNQDRYELGPSLLIDNAIQLWLASRSLKKEQDQYDFDSTILSSCECEDPAWSLRFSSGDYNTTKQWINTYNTTLYFQNVPVLYTPYFGFPTDTTRRTGLLQPTIGYSNDEGILYAQPFYYAPKSNYDIEVVPQVRNQRGYGYLFNYRLADSYNSLLQINVGEFIEQEDFYKDKSLANKNHYGYNLNYYKTKIFSDFSSIDQLYIDYVFMNDVDYINTQYNNNSNDYTDKYLESNLLYFYGNFDYLASLQLNYYNDISLTRDQNKQILQDFPKLTVDKFKSFFMVPNITYSFSLDQIRKSRDIGINSDITTLQAPVSFELYMFENYLKFMAQETFSFENYNYFNNESSAQFQDGYILKDRKDLSLSTNLLKPYENFIHNINFFGKFSQSDSIKSHGDLYSVTTDNSLLSSFNVDQEKQKYYTLGFKQTFFNNQGDDLLSHKISQSFVYNQDTNSYEKDNIFHQLDLNFYNIKFSNKLFYNTYIDEIVKSSTSLQILLEKLQLDSYHLYSYDPLISKKEETLNYKITTQLSRKWSIGYLEEQDITNAIRMKQEIFLGYDHKCWGLNLKYADSYVASNSIDPNDQAIRQKMIYFELDLKQLFQIDQSYKLNQR